MRTLASPDSDIRQEWVSPSELYQGLDREFRFNLDVAANVDNAKCLSFFSRTIDGLSQPWDGKRVWCNPPYKKIGPWIDKAIAQQAQRTLSVLLLPARTEQQWYKRAMMEAAEIAFFIGRIQFDPPRNVPASSNREGSILVVFDPNATVRRETLRDVKNGAVLYSWNRTLGAAA